MSLVVGALLAAGLLLTLAPWWWPEPEPLRARLERWRPVAALRELLILAGLPGRYWAATLVVAVLAGLVSGAVVQGLCRVMPLSAVVAVAGLVAPVIVLRARAAARRRLQRGLWPDVVDHLLSAIRSGLSLPDAVAALDTVGPAPLRPAFAAFSADYRAAGRFADGLDDLKTALADPVADRILETVRMARDVGGTELPAVLRALSAGLREESAIRTEAEARQSWVVNAARLGVAAPWAILLLLSSRPETSAAYNSREGAVLIIAGVVVSALAYQAMLRVGRLQPERRWFR
ncbi:type II secretion system F family protein [Plantibacter sp. ME-Dv--P-095]|uniref:type II secretion system F family protein n=1 Tax=Plantibacter sp. ME-Dv--P-095 TaxID=3040299 RepID=UPI00254E9515|nr:type II secretion system F family protein [Plantibacter sp. ME-Dv--P-095]